MFLLSNHQENLSGAGCWPTHSHHPDRENTFSRPLNHTCKLCAICHLPVFYNIPSMARVSQVEKRLPCLLPKKTSQTLCPYLDWSVFFKKIPSFGKTNLNSSGSFCDLSARILADCECNLHINGSPSTHLKRATHVIFLMLKAKTSTVSSNWSIPIKWVFFIVFTSPCDSCSFKSMMSLAPGTVFTVGGSMPKIPKNNVNFALDAK